MILKHWTEWPDQPPQLTAGSDQSRTEPLGGEMTLTIEHTENQGLSSKVRTEETGPLK